jgi:lambda family phage portal protein
LKLSLLDRAVLYFNPREAARRLYAKHLVENFVGRSYEAAGTGRRWKGVKSPSSNAEREVAVGLTMSRNRARELVRNNWIAGRGVDTVIANTVGHGIEISVKSKKALSLWNDWARTRQCDFYGTQDFFGLQQMALGTIVESGEVLLKKVRNKDSVVPLQIQLLEGDYIDTSRNTGGTDGNQVRNGIEFDSSGRVVAYFLFDQHPGALFPIGRGQFQSTRHTTDDVRLVFRPRRLGQVRGITWLHNVMLKMRDLDDYDDAQLFRQKIAACFAGFLKSTDLPLNSSTDTTDPISEKMQPGAIEVLPPGKEIVFSQPPGVGSDYDPFVRRQLMAVASGLGVTYEALTGDYSNVNFSSGRMGWIEMYRNIEMWRWGMFIPMFCEVVWDWFVEAGVVSGQLDSARVQVPTWTAPRREMIDPVKETQALKDQVRSGFVSYSESLREMGKDPKVHMEEMQKDFAELDRLGLTIESDPRFNLKGEGQTSGKSKEKGASEDSASADE